MIPLEEPSIALIDGDVLRYEQGSLTEVNQFYYNTLLRKGFSKQEANEAAKIPTSKEFVRRMIDERINGILKATGCSDYQVFLTGSGNFRFDIATLHEYKGNRNGVEKPYHFGTVDEYLREQYRATEVTGIEADDMLGLVQRSYFEPTEGEEVIAPTVICSRDKDLLTVEGWSYTWPCGKQKEKPLHWVTPEAAIKWFYTQLLTGDSTDNIIGCGKKEAGVYKTGKKIGEPYVRRKGVGPKAAENLLLSAQSEREMVSIVYREYLKVFGDDAIPAMLENGRLLNIGQTPDALWEFPYDPQEA